MSNPTAEIEAEHEALLRERAYQFELPEPPPPEDIPDPVDWGWLGDLFRFVGNLFSWLGPIIFWLFVALVAAFVCYLLFAMARGYLERRDGSKNKATSKSTARSLDQVDLRPDEEFAKDLLQQADRLAKEGRFAEALRLLLRSSVSEMQDRVRTRIGVSMTAREVGRIGQLPDAARAALHRIISRNELSVFAGDDVQESGYREARQDYETFAFAEGKPS